MNGAGLQNHDRLSSEWFLAGGVCLSAASLAVGYGLGGWGAGTVAPLVLGLAWLVGARRGWRWMASAGLVLVLTLAVIGIWLGLGAGWMLVAVVAALCAWDLDHLVDRLRRAHWSDEPSGRRRELERHHVQRLALVAGTGFTLAVLALGIRIRLTFLPAALLGLLAAWGLSRAVAFLRQESD